MLDVMPPVFLRIEFFERLGEVRFGKSAGHPRIQIEQNLVEIFLLVRKCRRESLHGTGNCLRQMFRFVVFLAGAAVTFAFFLSVPPVALHQIMFGGLENYALLAVPFFIFAGELMGAAGIADRLIACEVLTPAGRSTV